MKRILAIIGSPRRLGNSEILAKEISRNIAAPHELRLLRLTDFDIQPCRACYHCLFKDRCVIDDDYDTVAKAILEADAIMAISPTYFLSATAMFKRITDRGLAMYAHVERLWGKPSIGVGVAGLEGKEGYTLLGLENFLKSLLTTIHHCTMIYGALPGEVFLHDKNRSAAADLAIKLMADPLEPEHPHCPLCGGGTFRFLGGSRVRCMLCSNEGHLDMRENRPEFNILGGDHDLFLTLEDALKHKEWLMGMKSKFLANKNRLKKICLGYRREGHWIKPG